jgi:hypothetical protein
MARLFNSLVSAPREAGIALPTDVSNVIDIVGLLEAPETVPCLLRIINWWWSARESTTGDDGTNPSEPKRVT